MHQSTIVRARPAYCCRTGGWRRDARFPHALQEKRTMQRWPGAPGGFAPRNPRVTIRRIVGSFAPYRPQVLLVLAAVLVSSLLGLLPPFFLRRIVDEGLARGDISLVTRYTLLTLGA